MDMLGIAASASATFKKALEVTSHNVANSATPGYSRQRAEISSMNPVIAGNSVLGGGSQVNTVERIYADYIQKQLVSTNSGVKGYEQATMFAKQVEGVVASNDQGINEFMQKYFDSLQNLSNNPTSGVNRQLVLDQANSLTGHVGNVSEALKDTNYQLNAQIEGVTEQINKHLLSIKSYNEAVARANSQGTQPPNDLLDKREQAVLELSNLVGIKVFNQPNGTIDIHSANAKVPLLSDNNLTNLRAAPSPYPDENRTELYIDISGEKRLVTDYLIGGGELGGILDARKNVFDRAQNELGVTLNGFVASNNWQHYMGWDENGDAGTSLFTPLESKGLRHEKNSMGGGEVKVTFNPIDHDDLNAGLDTPYAPIQPANFGDKKADLEAAFTSIGQLTAANYEMRFDGMDWTVTNLTTKAETTFAHGSGNFVQFEGLRFEQIEPTAGAYVAGDRFVIKPHQDILAQFETRISNGQQLATRGQAPIETGNVPPGVAGDPLTDASPPEPAAIGDNVNIANMASLESKKILFANASGQPSETLLGGYSKMAAGVGMYVRGVEINFEAQTQAFSYINERREMMSGVSLDEEATNLMRFQQAYQAAAQIMQTSQTLFQTLLGVVRG
ncbi:MAG: flagellar hook-associated protein FlgK [Thiomicrospira sp.]|jgi:flagellar hook-associated protein 1 FlgK|nr:flagellar hook-associated protein FlgK [Thiomicrospira sp.]